MQPAGYVLGLLLYAALVVGFEIGLLPMPRRLKKLGFAGELLYGLVLVAGLALVVVLIDVVGR